MKRLITVFIAFAAISVTLSAQNFRYRGNVGGELGFGVLVDGSKQEFQYAYFGPAVTTVHGLEFFDAWNIGLGAGLGYIVGSDGDGDVDSGLLASIFLHTDYAFCKGRNTRPFVEGRVGFMYGAELSGPSFGIGAGLRIRDRWDVGFMIRRARDDYQYYAAEGGYIAFIPSFQFSWRF